MRFAQLPLLAAFIVLLGGCADRISDPSSNAQFAVGCVSVDGGDFYCDSPPATCTDGSWHVDGDGSVVCVKESWGGTGGSGGGGDDYKSGGGGGGGGSGGSGDGGDTGTYPATSGMEANDDIYSCHSLLPTVCTLAPADATQRIKIASEIEKIKPATPNEFCSEIKATLLDHFNRPAIAPQPGGDPRGSPAGIQVWSQELRSSDGKRLYADQVFVVIAPYNNVSEIHLWKDKIWARVMVHEAMHALEHRHDNIGTPGAVFDTPGGLSFDAWEKICVPNP